MKEILSKYQITNQIYSDERTLVYRATRISDQSNVIIKTPSSNIPELEEIDRLKSEYETTKSLKIEGIAKVYDLESFGNSIALIKEDGGEESLREVILKQKFSLSDFLKISVQLSQIIGELHNSKVIHKDINPSNILVNPQNLSVKLTDFSIATRIQRQIAPSDSYSKLEGTLDYISPEQTGRMNRTVDYRTDFYSLGITLYEVLTGQLPFQSVDPIDKIFSHLTKYPISPSQINSNIPEAISLIIMKLLAKQSEDRYHSSFGIKSDLENCLEQIQNTNTIINFTPGILDQSSQFIIPQKLFGRSQEIGTLLAIFERVSLGKSEILLVCGSPGIGKTLFINEINNSVLQKKGYFAHGKFEKLQRDSPYLALVNSIKLLIREILTYSSSEIEAWKEAFLYQLDTNAQVIIDFIPEIELIIGAQNPVPILGLKESQSRFHQVFKKFIYTFTQKGFPLVLFLDDLQWADSASLDLIEHLVNDIDTRYLFLIGSYRDNEVDASHPLTQNINKLRNSTCFLTEVALNPLDVSHVRELVCETLQCDLATSKSLADLVFYKTAGNPFFISQFLHILYDEGLIIYNFNTKNWQCNISQIQSTSLLDESIVELLVRNVQKLPQLTQKTLMLAACIGNEFTLDQLATINQSSYLETSTYLWPALQSGLILPLKNESHLSSIINSPTPDILRSDSAPITYKFLHDRIQQTSYSLIPSEQKKRTHLQIGELLLRQTSEEKIKAIIFTLVNQLNNGRELILDHLFKLRLASLNLIAGKKAKAAAAYEVSQKYLDIAIELLPESSWTNHYDLTLNIYIELIEIEYLNYDIESAEKHSITIESNAKKILDIVKVYNIKISFHFTQNQPDLALKYALYILEKIGIKFSINSSKLDIFLELIKVKFIERRIKNSNLLELKPMVDSHKIAAMKIMMAVIPSVFVARPNLFPIIIFKMVEYSIRYGNSPISSFAYASYSTIHSSILENISAGYHYNQIALKLLKISGATELNAKINVISNTFNRHWKDHIQESILSFPDGIKYGLNSGDIESAGHCAAFYCSYLFLSGENLNSVLDKQNAYIIFLNKHKQNFDLIHVKIWNQVVLNFLAYSSDSCNLNGNIFNEINSFLDIINSKNNILISTLYLAKISLNFILKNSINSTKYCSEAKPYIENIPGLIYISFYKFYYCLGLIDLYQSASSLNQKKYLKIINLCRKDMKKWAFNCPNNYQHKYDLMQAEYSKILEKDLVAIKFYDQAIKGAKENKYIQDEALANELAGEFYLSRGRDKIAKVYLIDAYHAYFRWGSLAKLKDLESRYSDLFPKNYLDNKLKSNSITYSNSYNSSLNFDFSAIYKSSQAISEEILLNKLVKKLIQILIQHTGAQNALLILSNDQKLVIEAAEYIDDDFITPLQSDLVNESNFAPSSIINYVARTHETLVLKNAMEDSTFSIDSYIRARNPKSVLCMPILNQGKLVGLIYLENNLAHSAFRDDHLEVLKLLCSQAAISIENAKLYQDLKESKERERTEREINELKSRFISIASHEFRTPLTTILGTSELIKYYSQNWPKEKTQTYLDRICDNVKNMVSLLDEVLFLSKGEAGKVDFQAEKTELIRFCQDLVNESQLGAKSGQTINFSCPDELLTVEIDQRLLQHILRNLLSNAVKYSFPESVVLFELSIVGNKINFKIQDQGIGIPEEDQKKLFGSFHRANNVGSIPGSGLGLSIVKQCVDVHGGTINVMSQVGVGTTFIITLPLTQ